MDTKPLQKLGNRSTARFLPGSKEFRMKMSAEVKSYKPLEQINSLFEKKNIEISPQ